MAHEDLKKLYALDAEETDKPWERWETLPVGHTSWTVLACSPGWYPHSKYRRKPGLPLPQGAVESAGDTHEALTFGPLEADPSGKSAHEPGAKLDAGKVRPSLILSHMPRAMLAVAEVATFGARKYSAGGWQTVDNGIERYTDAMDRHRLAEAIDGPADPQSGLPHAAHEAWNALARLELMLREAEAKQAECA